jgi:zinc transport system permease protein
VSDILQFFEYDFLRNAVLASVLASVACGVIGTFIVVKRLVFISGGISHAAFGGLGVCYFFGWPPLWGAFAVAALMALLLGPERGEKLRSHDALIGVLWAVGMAIGTVFIYKTPGYAPNLMSYLFGDILTVSQSDIWVMFVMDVSVVIFLLALYKELVATSFDPTFAQIQGAPVGLLQTLLLLFVGFAIVVLIQVVGIILVIALLTIPALTSLLIWRNFAAVLAGSVIVSLVMTLAGLWLSYAYDWPTGPAIVLLGVVLLLSVQLLQGVRRSRGRIIRLG